MSATGPFVGSFEFSYQPSEDALKEAIDLIMRYGEEHQYFENIT